MTVRVVQDKPTTPRDITEHPVVRTMNAIVAVMMVPYYIKQFFTRYWTHPRVLLRSAPIKHERISTVYAADEHRIAPPVLEYLELAERALAAQGFSAPHRRMSGAADPIIGVASLLEHPHHGDLASVTALQKANFVGIISFQTEFADGICVQTTNSRTVTYWPPEQRYDIVRFPNIQESSELYRLHRFRVSQRERTAPRRASTRGATEQERLAHVEAETQGWRDNLVLTGYRELTPDGLKTTTPGANRGAWRALFPWLTWIQWRQQRAATHVLAQLARAS